MVAEKTDSYRKRWNSETCRSSWHRVVHCSVITQLVGGWGVQAGEVISSLNECQSEWIHYCWGAGRLSLCFSTCLFRNDSANVIIRHSLFWSMQCHLEMTESVSGLCTETPTGTAGTHFLTESSIPSVPSVHSVSSFLFNLLFKCSTGHRRDVKRSRVRSLARLSRKM